MLNRATLALIALLLTTELISCGSETGRALTPLLETTAEPVAASTNAQREDHCP